MNIGILTVTDPALRKLQADGPTGGKAARVESEATEAATSVAPPKPRPTGNVAPSVKFASLRAALNARIAGDVSIGTLTESDAVVVGQTLDEIENGSGGQDPAQFGAYSNPTNPHQVARAYLATIEPGTLIDRFG